MEASLATRPPTARESMVDVRFASRWEVIDDTRDFLVRTLGHVVADALRIDQLGIAAHELMENAFRYSPGTSVSIRVEIDGGIIRITAENDATPERMAALQAQIEEIRANPDPLVHYQRKMLEAVDRSDGSGLGLARIRWESQLELDFEIEGSRVRVIASGNITS